MERKAVRGVPWTLFSYAGNKVITVTTTLVLARLLVPADFGVAALALLVVGVLNLIGDLGLAATFVLRQDLNERAKGTLLTMMLAMGATMAVVGAAISPLMGSLLDEPRLTNVLAVMSLSALLVAPTWFYEALLQRELEFRRRFAGMTAQSLTNAATALTLAALGAGVWSIVVGQLAATVAYGGVLLALAPYRVRPTFDRAAARDLFSTSSGFLVQTGASFTRENLDYAIVGRVLGSSSLGIYSVAYRLCDLTYWAVADPVAKVTFPAFARARERGEDISASFLAVLRLVALVVVPAGVFVSAAADPFTRTLFDEKWLPMIAPLTALGLWAAVRPVEATIGWLLNSVGAARSVGKVAALMLVPLAVGIVVAAHLGDLTTVAWVILADRMVALPTAALLARRHADVPLRAIWNALWPVAVAAAPAWFATHTAADAIGHLHPLVALIGASLSGAGAFLAVLSIVAPGILPDAVRQARRTVSRAPEAEDPAAPAAEDRPREVEHT